VGSIARSLECLLQVGLRGGVSADPLRDMQPRRGHVGTDGLVFPPRHRRSARRNAEAEARERSKTLESEGGMPGAGLVGYGRMVWLGWVAVLGGFQYFGVARLGNFRFGVLRFYH
jgi:hypothetical protein